MSAACPGHNNGSAARDGLAPASSGPEGCRLSMFSGPDGHGSGPAVSICIPTYHHADQVERLLDSIAAQTFRDYEVVISDDSGDSGIRDLIREMLRAGRFSAPSGLDGEDAGETRPPEETPPCLRYYHNETPLGHIYNWNRAIDLAKGGMIKIMFSDDWFTFPDSLERMVRLLEEDPQALLAFCGSRQTPLPGPDGTPAAKVPWDRCASPEFIEELQRDYRYLFMGDEIGAPSATLFRSCGARFVEGSSWASDMFLYFEILTRNPRFSFSPDPLISIGIHGEQYTDSFTERDIRKYRDDRAMYERYDIGRSEACRRRMLHQNVMYRQGRKAAADCGASLPEYLTERISWFYTNTILGYWGGLKHKLRRQKG